ncbi:MULTISPECIES: hypothetical protein [Streptomyces]|uniref:Uncharacterized protein n=1 Tax=Streptomyces dengpaensis TaxID=2049881 RepID=A0ABM6SSV4_9ACTN|nr:MULTISPECIES: hypothetical protein [Streptomyces]AVH57645.1 hypothetical protein C4B68_19835 [Streptomyces dengpaensis]PIB07850.1 hypothetical protein B1C81_17945 [Streptomyces sp. HG99]
MESETGALEAAQHRGHVCAGQVVPQTLGGRFLVDRNRDSSARAAVSSSRPGLSRTSRTKAVPVHGV